MNNTLNRNWLVGCTNYETFNETDSEIKNIYLQNYSQSLVSSLPKNFQFTLFSKIVNTIHRMSVIVTQELQFTPKTNWWDLWSELSTYGKDN